MANFAVELFKQAAASGDENALISPVSAYLALAMTANGADGATLEEFEAVLGKYGLTTGDINAASKAFIDMLTETEGGTTLNIADSIWYRENFAAAEDFLQTNADYYGASAYSADFDRAETVDMINEWVSDGTNGLIEKLVEELDPESVMLLINTIYLKAAWQNEFDANDNTEGDFSLENGETAAATYMSNGIDSEQYIDTENGTGILLPYDDGKLAFLAVMPEEGTAIRDYIASFDENTISSLAESAEKKAVYLKLPKFKAEFEIKLNDILSDMGLSSAFAVGGADFGKMSTDDSDLFISSVLQKTYLTVNEAGTEAAAATSVEVSLTAAPAEDFIELTFDRPFVYAVVDLETNLPLFIGVMENPSA